MPIIHFANSKNQNSGGFKKLLGYVSIEKKTKLEDRQFVSGVNCSPESAYREMMLTKQIQGKTGGRLYYHLVQSFPKGYDIKPELAHKISVELAEKALKDYECVVATHIDREHIHSHIVFNSVSFEDGKKYHSDNNSLHNLMKLSDEICESYGVAVLDKPTFNKDGQKDVLGDKEYRSALRGESFKFALMNVITDCMKQAKSKKHFIGLMKRRGYSVRWENERKYITYTTPKGKRCRCNKLHDRRFLKEVMEYEFEIRDRIFNGTQQGQYAAGSRDTAYGGRSGAELDGGAEDIEFDMSVAGRAERKASQIDDNGEGERVPIGSAGYVRGVQTPESQGAFGGSSADADSERGTLETGWESERRILISAERARQLAAESKLKAVQSSDICRTDSAVSLGDVVALAAIIEDSDEEEEKHYSTVDRKQLKEEWEKKESLGMHMG